MFVPILLQSAATYVTAGSIYTENTIVVLITLLMVLALSVQIARNYFLRILRKFTLRLAADIWWLVYILLRDASIFLVVFLGFMLFWPAIYQDFPIAVPFEPLAIDFYAMALVLMLVADTDEVPLYNSIVTILVLIGTVLYITGVIFVTESATALAVLPATVSLSTSNIWGYFNANFNSINNPDLSIYTFYVTFGILSICGAVAIIYSFKGGIMNRTIEPKPKPAVKETINPPQAK
jgi:hypothetical protein